MVDRTHRTLSPTELKRLHRDWRRRTNSRLAIILDGVQNPFNVGSIIRSAAAYRTACIWYTDNSLPPTHDKVAKTALGCERFVDFHQVTEATEALSAARADGFTTVAVELTTEAVPMFELDLSGDVCLVVGHEDRGVKKETLAEVDFAGYLPLVGKVGSLNVAQATTGALYEVLRQQWVKPSA